MYRRYSHFITNHQAPVGLGTAFINPDFTTPDHAVNTGPRHALQPRQKEIVQAPVSIVEIYGDRSRTGMLYGVFHNLKGL
jgi:hypothetical protein